MIIKYLRSLFLLFGVGFMLLSCSIDDGSSEMNFAYKLNSIKEVSIPDTLLAEEMYSFRVEFKDSADCYEFKGFHIEEGHNPNERMITAVSTVINEDLNCVVYPSPKTESAALEFTVLRDDYYVLNFWQGEDEKGYPQYLTKKVVIK